MSDGKKQAWSNQKQKEELSRLTDRKIDERKPRNLLDPICSEDDCLLHAGETSKRMQPRQTKK